MRKRLKNIMLFLLILGAIAFAFIGSVKADESDDLAQDLANEGISQDAMNELLSGSGDTLGERAQNMLNNGSITQGQYDKIYNNVMNMPEEKRQALKNAYDKGYGDKIYDRTADKVHQQMDKASRRDHIKDLKEQGLSREEIKDRIENIRDKKEDRRDRREDIKDKREDVRDRREDIRDRKEDIWDAKHDGGKRDKLEDIRDRREDIRDRKEDIKDRREDRRDKREDLKDRRDNASQHELDKAHEKYQDKTGPANRVDHAKDRSGFVKDKPRLREGVHNQKDSGGKRGR